MIRLIVVLVFFADSLSAGNLRVLRHDPDSLKTILPTAINDTMRFETYARIAWAYLEPRVELDLGRAYADSLHQAANRAGNKKWKLRSHYFYGAYERFKGNYASAIDYLIPYVDYYVALGDSNWVADGLFQLATIYTNLGDFPKSISALHRIIAIDKALGNPGNVAHSLNSLGVAFFNAGRYSDAISTYRQAEAIYDSIGTPKSFVFLNLGNVYTKTRELDLARINYAKALEIDQKNNSQYGIALVLANLGQACPGNSGDLRHRQDIPRPGAGDAQRICAARGTEAKRKNLLHGGC